DRAVRLPWRHLVPDHRQRLHPAPGPIASVLLGGPGQPRGPGRRAPVGPARLGRDRDLERDPDRAGAPGLPARHEAGLIGLKPSEESKAREKRAWQGSRLGTVLCTARADDAARRSFAAGSLLGRKDRDDPALVATLEVDGSGGAGIERVVLALADTVTRLEDRPALANDDLAAGDLLAREDLHAQALSLRVTAVAARTK